MQLYDYIPEIVEKGVKILKDNNIVIFNMDMRTGKTPSALETCKALDYKNVLCITGKEPIEGFAKVYNDIDLKYFVSFNLEIVNYEMLHKYVNIDKDKKIKINPYINHFDCIIIDECHHLGAYKHNDKQRINKRQKQCKIICENKPIIMLSGTLTSETWSQIWPILNTSTYTPFEEKTFRKFAEKYVNIKQKWINGFLQPDYTDAKIDLILEKMGHLLVFKSQADAGFLQEIKEYPLYIPTPQIIKDFALMIIKDKVIEIKSKGILITAETASSEKSKLLQIASGTVIDNDLNRIIISDYKAKFIKEYFAGKKLMILYNFRAEKTIIERNFNITENHKEFNESDNLTLCKQITSGSEGIDAGTADAAVFFNVHYSGRAYTQVRQRINFKTREIEAAVYFCLSEIGIEKDVWDIVKTKSDYTNVEFTKFKFEKLSKLKNKTIELFGE